MELEFCKHFKDATNLLLMMDHDSGYVEGVESYTLSSNESDSLKEIVGMRGPLDPDNFLLSEDALLEKPEIYLNLGNLAHEIDNEDYEETRRLFFSPEFLPSSVKSSDSSIVYSGLENETNSEMSDEIPLQIPIVVQIQESSLVHKEIKELDASTASGSDMSLEVSTFDPVIIEKKDYENTSCSLTSPLKGFSRIEGHVEESAINKQFLIDNVNKKHRGILETQDGCTDKSHASKLLKSISTFQKSVKCKIELENKDKTVVSNNMMSPALQDKKTIVKDTNVIKSSEENSVARISKSTSGTPNREIAKCTIETTDQLLTSLGALTQISNTEPGCSNPLPEGAKTSHVWTVGPVHKSETPSKINPLTTVTNTFEISKDKRRLTLVFSKNEKENGYCVKRKYPSMTPEKNYKNPVNPDVSPDIFGDEMIYDKSSYFQIQSQDNLLPLLTHCQMEEKYVNKLDQKLLKRTQDGMSGVLPPPSVTVIRMSVVEILAKLEENKSYFWNNDAFIKKDGNEAMEEAKDSSLNSSSESNVCSKSLLINVDLEKAKDTEWPDVLNMRYHGLYHNSSKISEEIADLCDKYQKRFVGAESQSTCTVFETLNLTSPTKRKMTKPRWGGKSPGRRLSHLARRRITFSSTNLQAGGSSLAGSRARQILVDAKKIELLNRRKSPRKSPRKTPRKTPNKSPKVKTRTPSSSAKKKLAMRFRKLTGEFEKSIPSTSELSAVHRAVFKSPEKSAKSENSKGLNRGTKRALFQSPNRDMSSSLFTNKSQDFSTSEDRSQLRRALFTSPKKVSPFKGKKSPFKGKKSPFKHALQFGYEKKRKRSESEDARPSKFSRSMSMDVRPSTSGVNKTFTRAQSELSISLNRSQSQLELTDQHKKKLQWAVYGALQTQNITSSHPQWKVWASVLGRVTCRFFTSQMASRGVIGAKLEGGTTERMNRIARRHVISVIKGKSVDEIINEYVTSRPRVHKPQGYVAPEEFNNLKNKMSSDIKEGVFQDRANTIESWEKRKLEQMSKPTTDNKIERIRKVINFGDDR